MANNKLVDVIAAKSFIEANWPNDPLLKQIAFNLLDKLPRADAVEVVRCKDCKMDLYCNQLKEGSSKLVCTKSVNWRAVEPNHFCSYGEKKP